MEGSPSRARFFLRRRRNLVQPVHRFGRKPQSRGVEVFAQMVGRGRARDDQDVGRAVEQPRQSDLPRRGAQRGRGLIQDGGLQRPEPTQRKERHEGDALACQTVDQSVIQPMREIVVVLDAHDFGDLLALRELAGRDVAEADVPDQPLCLQLREHRKRLGDGIVVRPELPPDAKIDHVQDIES